MIDLARAVRSCSRDDFIKRHPGFYLVPLPGARRARAAAGTMPNLPALAKRPTEGADPIEVERIVLEIAKLPDEDRPLHVGRTDDNDVIISDPTVSRRHAAFVISQGRVEVVDLDSRNGTRVRGIALRAGESQRLGSGDDVRFGSVTLMLADAGAAWDALNER